MADLASLSTKEVQEAFDQALCDAHKKGKITKDVYQRCLKRSFPTKECILSGYSPAKRVREGASGYTQVRYKGTKYYCHRIAARVAGLHLGPGQEASHCCPINLTDGCGGNRNCFNPAHMAAEDGFTNKSRLCCLLFSEKPGYLCPHKSPPCWGAVSLSAEIDSQAAYWQPSQ